MYTGPQMLIVMKTGASRADVTEVDPAEGFDAWLSTAGRTERNLTQKARKAQAAQAFASRVLRGNRRIDFSTRECKPDF